MFYEEECLKLWELVQSQQTMCKINIDKTCYKYAASICVFALLTCMPGLLPVKTTAVVQFIYSLFRCYGDIGSPDLV